MAVWKLTTSIICISVRPKLNTRGSDSLPTGRSSTLYVSSRSFSSRFSWEPPFTSPDQLSFFQSTLCISHDFSTTLSNPRLASSTSRVLPRSTLPLFQKNTKFSLLFEICSRNFFFSFLFFFFYMQEEKRDRFDWENFCFEDFRFHHKWYCIRFLELNVWFRIL